MESIENYKKRFFNLMESTIGDVRPLITEALTEDKVKEYKSKWSVSNVLKNEKSKEMYQTAIVNGNLIPTETTEDSEVVNNYNKMLKDGRGDELIRMYDMFHNTKSSELGKSPITNPQELTGDELTKFYNAMIGTYMNVKGDFDGRIIFATLLKNRDSKVPVKTVQSYINQETGKNYNLIDIYNKLTDKEKLAVIGQKQTSK